MFSSDVQYQWLAALCVNILEFGFGTVVGWPSASLLILQSKDTPLPSGPLTIEQVSWVGSLVAFGGLVGNSIFGWLSGRYGRKYPLMVAAIPQLLGWLLIIFARNPMYLYAARFLSGISGGAIYVIIPVFVAEISDNRVRGTLGSLLLLSCNLGIVVAFVLGYFCTYFMSPILLISVPVIFLICMSFFPESPQFLIRNGREEEAEKAICFYRNIDWHSKEEFGLLRGEMDKLKTATQTTETDLNERTSGTSWRDFTTPVARKAIFIGLTLLALKQFCGLYAMLNYAGQIFQDSGSKLDPNMSAIIVGCIQLVGTYVPTLLVDRAGRKILMTFSMTGTGIGLVILGSYKYLQSIGYDLEGFTWIPLASFSYILFIGCAGLMPLPFIIISEIMPQEIRSAGSSLCMCALWLYAFLMIKSYPLLSLTFGMHGCLFMFAGVTFGGALFVIFVLPETKGKSFDEIMRIMKA